MVTKFPKKQITKKQQAAVINRLRNAGIQVQKGKKAPENGRYSGIVGKERKERVLEI
ncbi:hypothetical protein [Gracilibacillus sp. YIM 98692]|uniref:hypothetical protein n=1 Tax=Gracilibacillus sp. YIM 98692 TaxID=2663532 RepID=UPI0013D38390|nr:hypothetical protein [Gracilibacillus sp. YIM 98692]